MNEIKGKSVLIAGYGREGKSVFNFLRKNYPEIEIAIADKNPEAVSGVNLATYSGTNYLAHAEKFDTVVLSPGISKTSKGLENARCITTATNIFFEYVRGSRIIGITGTKGKSTTSSLIAHILQSTLPDVRLVGNVGIPVLDHVNNFNSNTVFVVELSSYQLDTIHYSPHIAVILPIFEEHLNYHGSMEKYVASKSNITKHQTAVDYLVFYKDNTYTVKIADSSKAKKISFGKKEFKSKLLGDANKINMAAAYTVAKLFTTNDSMIKTAISTFEPLPHRLESVGVFNNIEFINDSLSTIPEATINALECFPGRIGTLIAGGYDRGIDYSKLASAIINSGIKSLVLFPDTGKKIEAYLPSNDINIFHTDSMEEAIRFAYKNTPPGEIVLLSPASTSFNLFIDYEDRGNKFKKFAYELSKDFTQ